MRDVSDEWVGSVGRSGLDSKVWVAVLPDTDTYTGAMQASTSLRKCKAHVERHVDGKVRWENDEGHWNAYLADEE